VWSLHLIPDYGSLACAGYIINWLDRWKNDWRIENPKIGWERGREETVENLG